MNKFFITGAAGFIGSNLVDRLLADGRLEDYRVKDDWEGRKKIAKGFGFLFFGTGLVLLVLIVYAMLSRLGH